MKPTTCFAPAHILLPSEQVPLEQWGCIACDQFTSDRSYWQRAEETAAGAPSALNLILPEVYLEDGDVDARVAAWARNEISLVIFPASSCYKSVSDEEFTAKHEEQDYSLQNVRAVR